jgi:predicted ester cyclase
MKFFKKKKDKAAAAAPMAAAEPAQAQAAAAEPTVVEEIANIPEKEVQVTTTTTNNAQQGKKVTRSPTAANKTKNPARLNPVKPPQHVHIPANYEYEPEQPPLAAALKKSLSPQAKKSPTQRTSNIMKTPPSSIPDSTTTTNSSNTNNINSSNNNLNSHLDAPDASIEVTRDLVKRFISDIWNRGEIECIPNVCHPSLRFNGHVGMDRVGHEGFARMVTTVRDALTDYHCEIHSMVVESNKAFCRLRFTGKHTGNLLGYPPTGKTVAWMGASEFTCKNGKILKVWELGDVKSLEEQLKETDDEE